MLGSHCVMHVVIFISTLCQSKVDSKETKIGSDAQKV